MIKKLLIFMSICILITEISYAKTTQLNYKATFGIFGTVGTIRNTLIQNGEKYSIKTTVKLAGLAKLLMGGQTEEYLSRGHMKNGLMVSDTYTMTSRKKDKVTQKSYTINHKKRYVTKRYRKWIKGKVSQDETQKLSFYAKDDLLTLYFNLGHAIKEKGKTYLFKAVGLEKQQGKVNITVPNDTSNASYKKDLGSGAKLYAKARIHQKNFRKKKGDILLALDKDGYIKKSVIKDILMYGDAELIRTK
ncbi:MAG: hypothetical protein L3J43_06080 [Sulfurovum sp.]|nr:hypothetical protein [Sulfurovum sp.]